MWPSLHKSANKRIYSGSNAFLEDTDEICNVEPCPQLFTFYIVWYEPFNMRRNSLPAYCHSPSVIRDKKNLRDTDQAGVIRSARGLPRQSDKPDASGWPEVISLSEHTVDVLVSLYLFPSPTLTLEHHSFPCVPSPPRSLSADFSKIAVCAESQRSKNLSQLKGKRKGRVGSCLWS